MTVAMRAHVKLVRMVGALALAAILGGWVGQTTAHAAQEMQGPTFTAVAAAADRRGSASLAPTAAYSETVVFDIAEFVTNERVTIEVSSTLEGPIQAGSEWSLCAGATNVTVNPHGGSCQHDAPADKIVCSAPTQRIDIAYACLVAIQGIFTDLVFQFQWEFEQPTDRTVEVRHPDNLAYLDADPTPAEELPGALRWSQQDSLKSTIEVAFRDTGVRSIYLPLVNR